MKLTCSNCGTKLNIPEHLYGKKGKCPKCGVSVSIPREPEQSEILTVQEVESNSYNAEFPKENDSMKYESNAAGHKDEKYDSSFQEQESIKKQITPHLSFGGIVAVAAIVIMAVWFFSLIRTLKAPDNISNKPSISNGVSNSNKPFSGNANSEEKNKEYEILHGLRWDYRNTPDDMGRGIIKIASVRSVNEFEFDSPYEGIQRAALILRIHPKHGKDVMLSVEKGQFLCEIDSCSVDVRFDENNVMPFSVGEPSDYSTTMLFFHDYDSFMYYLRKSKKVYIEARFFMEATEVFEFNVSGLKW